MKPAWTGRICALLGALAVLLGAAPAAPAASYDVWSCRGPAGEPLTADGWSLTTRNTTAADVVVSDDCAAGGPLSIAFDGTRIQNGSARATLTFRPPPGSAISGFTLLRGLYAPASAPGFSYTFTAGVTRRTPTEEAEFGCASVLMPPNGNCSASGSLTDPSDPLNREDAVGVALDGVQLSVACISGSCQIPFANRAATVALHGARISLDDSLAPTAPELSGTLLDGPVDRRATLLVESADDGGGIASMSVSVDGGTPVVSAPAGPRGTCAEPYAVAQPCPAAAARLFTLDTGALADGAHSVSGEVVDAAGNATPFGPVAFTVAHPVVVDPPVVDPPPVVVPPVTPLVPAPPVVPGPVVPVGNGTPAVRQPRLTLAAAAAQRGGRGGAARVSGRLTTRGGTPITGATLTVSARPLGVAGGRTRTLPAVRTGADGRFTLRLGGSGGAERVEVAFAPSADGASTARAETVVRGSVRLTVTRSRARLKKGEAVVIGGRLDGAGASARGAVVELQAIVRGGWRTVGTVRASADGSYRWRYRFVNTTRDTIFSFRALVRDAPGWPWPELTTRTVRVRVDAR